MLATTPRRSLRIEKLHSTPKNDNRATDDKENNVNNNKSYSPSTSNNTEEDDSRSGSSDDKQAFNGVDVSTQTPIPTQNVMIKQEDQGEDCSDGSCVNDFARCDGTDAKQEEENDDDDQSTGSFDNKRRTDDDLSTRSNGNDTVDSVDSEQAPNVTTVSTQTPIRNQTIHTVMIKQEASIEITKEVEEDDDDDQSTGDSVSEKEVTNMSTQVNEAMLHNNNLVPVKVESNNSKLEKVGDEDSSTDSGDKEQDPKATSTQPPKLIINPPVKHEDEKEDNNSDVGDIDLVHHTINPSISVDRLADGEDEDDSYDAESKNLMPEKRDAVDEDNLTSDNASGDDSSCLPSTVQSYTEKSDEELVAPESNIVTSSDVFPFNAVDIHALLQATLPPTPSSSKTQPIEGVSEQPDKEGCASLANTRDLFGTPFSDNEVSSRIQKRNKDHSFASSSESLENKSSSKLSLGDGSLNLDGTNFFENYKYGGALSPLSDVSQDDNADKSGVLAALLAAKDNTIASQGNALVSMELKLSESQRRAEYFQKEYKSMKLKLAQSDTANAILQAEKKKRSKEVEDLQDNFSKLSDKNGILKHGLSTKEAEIENLQSQFDALIVENATLKDDHNNLKEEVKSMKDNVNRLTSENSLLKKEFDTAKGRIAVLSVDNAVLVEEKDNLIVVVKSNEDDVNGLTSENASLKEELDKAQVLNNDNAELAKEKARLEGQVVALEKDNSVIVTANAQLEKQLTTAKQEITSLHESNEMLRGEISYAKTEHVTVKQDLEDLIVSSGEKTRINASLKNELANANDNNNALSEEVKNLKDIVEVLTSNITRLNEESDATKARFVSLKNDKASLAEENLSLEDQVVALEEDKRALFTDNKHLFKHAETLKREKKDFKREIKELNDEIAQKDIDSEMINKALSKEVVEKHKLKEENDKLKKETELWKQREQSLLQGFKRSQRG